MDKELEDDSILDQQDAALTTTYVETPNTFGHNLLRRLGLAQGSGAEATGSSSIIIMLVPQGSVLGPLIFFSLYNDLHNKVESSIRLCADNVILHAGRLTVKKILLDYREIYASLFSGWFMKLTRQRL